MWRFRHLIVLCLAGWSLNLGQMPGGAPADGCPALKNTLQELADLAGMQATEALTRGLLAEKVTPAKIVAANRQIEVNRKLRLLVEVRYKYAIRARRDAVLHLAGCPL